MSQNDQNDDESNNHLLSALMIQIGGLFINDFYEMHNIISECFIVILGIGLVIFLKWIDKK